MPHPEKPVNPTEVDSQNTTKGKIHWFEFVGDYRARTIDDIHPCIIIGRNNPKSKRVIISPISDAENYITKEGTTKYPFHVLLKKSEYKFLDKDSVILLDQVFTIPKEILCEEWYMGEINNTRLIDESIMQNYDLIQTVRDLLHEMIDKISETQIV